MFPPNRRAEKHRNSPIISGTIFPTISRVLYHDIIRLGKNTLLIPSMQDYNCYFQDSDIYTSLNAELEVLSTTAMIQ